jgi:uncharacterized membrane protein YesL
MGDQSPAETTNQPASVAVVWTALRDWYDDIIGALVINTLWLLSWLTIVLGPPATFGVYYYAHYMAHGINEGVQGMLEGARRFLIKSWMTFAVFALGDILLGVNILFYWQMGAVWSTAVGAFFMLLLLLWLITQFYAMAYIMEQEEPSLKMALKNGFFTIFAAPGYTFVVVGLAFSLIAISAALIFPLFFGIPVLIALIAAHAVRERLETYQVRERNQLTKASFEDNS